MARQYRCKYTGVHRCKEGATARLRLTFTIVPTPQVTRVCEAHRIALEAMCSVAGIGFEVLPSPAAVRVRKAVNLKWS